MYKYLFILILSLFSSLSFSQDSNDVLESIMGEKGQLENIEFNKTVSDEEIIEYFKRALKYQPSDLKEFDSQSKDERHSFLSSYRDSFNKNRIPIPVLRNLTQKQLELFDELAKYSAKSQNKAKLALDKMSTLKEDDYKLIAQEGAKLIRNYNKKTQENKEVIREKFPQKLAFLDLDVIHVGKNTCTIFLQKWIGKGIGYSIRKSENDLFEISSFNHYESWEEKILLKLNFPEKD